MSTKKFFTCDECDKLIELCECDDSRKSKLTRYVLFEKIQKPFPFTMCFDIPETKIYFT